MQPQLIAGRYQVLRAIGRGGMGTVWLCRDEILGREVAVKQIGTLPGDSASETKRAMREARSAAALNHPNAVAVYDVVDHESRSWLVMEYVEGETLADEILREGPLSAQRVADVGSQLAGALARAHQRLIVHRDIKPGNVLIDKAGRPKISDFGIARGHGDEALTQVGFITGTPGYLSPELARGSDPHPASDVWALGATLYAAVEGQPPYEPRSNPIATLRAIATERPRPMVHAGVLAPAISAMMHEDPTCRWDMATSARRLGGIARAAALAAPRADPTATRVIAAPGLDSTQAFEPTRQLKAVEPVVAPVAPAAAETAAAKPPSVAKAPAGAASAEPRPEVAEAPSTQAPVVARAPVSSGAGVAGPLESHRGAVAAPPGDKGSGRRWWPLGLVALLVVALGTFLLLSQLGDQGAPVANPVATRSSPPAKPAVTTAPQVSDPPSATTPGPSSTTAPPTTGTNGQLEDFVASYYANVIHNRDSTWTQLSPRMQSFAGGRSSYESFWKSIRSVSVNRVQANAAANTAVVNLTFTSTSGRTSTENHNFTFVRNGSAYLIESDR